MVASRDSQVSEVSAFLASVSKPASNFKRDARAEDVAQDLRALVALLGDQGSVPSTTTVAPKYL